MLSFLCAAGVQVQTDAPVRPSHLSTGARRSFFCRMKHSRVAGKLEDKRLLPSTSKKKGEFRLETRPQGLPNTASAAAPTHLYHNNIIREMSVSAQHQAQFSQTLLRQGHDHLSKLQQWFCFESPMIITYNINIAHKEEVGLVEGAAAANGVVMSVSAE